MAEDDVCTDCARVSWLRAKRSLPERFYVQDPHVDGLAVLDRATGSLIVFSFGDTGHEARVALDAVAAALNAATDSAYPFASNEFKRVVHEAPTLVWRVIEELSHLYLRETRGSG